MIDNKSIPYVVKDNLFPSDMLRDALELWPTIEWDGWYKYEEAKGGKLASNLKAAIPLPCANLLYRMSLLPIGEWLGVGDVVADLGLWGAGLHELPIGCELPIHLDAEIHPRLKLRRVATSCLYINSEWQEDWGGELDIEGLTRIPLLPGRLVVFKNTPIAYHRVRRVKGLVSRKALAVFFYSEVLDDSCSKMSRERALFL